MLDRNTRRAAKPQRNGETICADKISGAKLLFPDCRSGRLPIKNYKHQEF
jgi:hypothetical protein